MALGYFEMLAFMDSYILAQKFIGIIMMPNKVQKGLGPQGGEVGSLKTGGGCLSTEDCKWIVGPNSNGYQTHG